MKQHFVSYGAKAVVGRGKNHDGNLYALDGLIFCCQFGNTLGTHTLIEEKENRVLEGIPCPIFYTKKYKISVTHWKCIDYPSTIRKYSSPTSSKNKAKLEYINEGQPLPLELAFGVGLGLYSHS